MSPSEFRARSIFGIILLGICQLSVSSLESACLKPGECTGYLLGEKDSYTNCALMCKEYVGESKTCGWFTWNRKTKICIVLRDCKKFWPNADGLTGESSCLYCLQPARCLYGSTDCRHHSCVQQTCITSESCTFYTFSFDSSRCLLFSNCPMIVDSDDANSATSEVDCAVPREGEFLFVAGGWDIWGSSSRVELIMLDDLGAVRTPPPCLQSLERLPEASNSGSGASLIGSGGLPHVCDGYHGGYPTLSCLRYHPGNDSWTASGKMDQARVYGGQTHHPDWGLVMAGGGVSTVEFTRDGVAFNPLPDLPRSSSGLCLVALDSERLFIAGLGTFGADCYLHFRGTDRWTKVGSMPTGRTDHYCGVVMRSDNRCLEVVVAGGRDYINGAYLDVVEIYDVGTDSWREGNPLIYGMAAAYVVPYQDTFLLVGGNAGFYLYLATIIRYEPANDTWTELPVHLYQPREFAVAMTIAADLFPEC